VQAYCCPAVLHLCLADVLFIDPDPIFMMQKNRPAWGFLYPIAIPKGKSVNMGHTREMDEIGAWKGVEEA